jgi:transposase
LSTSDRSPHSSDERKKIEFLKVALETERGQSLPLAQKAEEGACRLKDLEAARYDLAHTVIEAEPRELSLRTALDEAERASLAGKEQFAEVQALLSRERQRSAELADAVAATENVRTAERERRDGSALKVKTAHLERWRISRAGLLKDLAKALPHLEIEIVKRPDHAKSFEVLSRRWVVERTFANERPSDRTVDLAA